MDPATAVSYGLVLVTVGGVVAALAATQLRPVAHILRNDPLAVRDLVYHDGPAEVEGAARADDETVRAPFTGVECLVYEYEAQEYRSSGQSSYWKTLDEGAAAVPFLLEDDTGAVRVDAPEAELHVETRTVTVPAGEEPPERIARYIRQTDEIDPQHGRTVDLVVTELNVGNRQRFRERRVDPGDEVYVYGALERAPAGEWGSGVVDALLTRGGSPLVVSDTSELGTALRIGRWPLLFLAGALVLLLPGVGLLGYGLLALLLW